MPYLRNFRRHVNLSQALCKSTLLKLKDERKDLKWERNAGNTVTFRGVDYRSGPPVTILEFVLAENIAQPNRSPTGPKS